MPNREDFETFLASIPLTKYRGLYKSVKIVEMDLPKNIQAISLIYQIYWDKRIFLDFDKFYEAYLGALKKPIEEFRIKITMCQDCFYRGLKARIYRTWASLITQIQGGYVAESVFGKGNVKMSEDLDHMGADIYVNYKEITLNYQVKKESQSGVRSARGKPRVSGEIIELNYNVPTEDYFINPKKLNGEFKAPYLRFTQNKTLKRFDNGFVVFTDEAFLPKKKEIDSNSQDSS